MKIIRNVLFVLLIYIVFVFLACMVIGFFAVNLTFFDVGNEFTSKITNGLIIFLRILPSSLITGCLIGFSKCFGNTKEKVIKRFSSTLAQYVKSVFVIGLLCTLICVISSEVINPLIHKNHLIKQKKIENYNEYINLARKYFQLKKYDSAILYSSSALRIESEGAEASELKDIIEISKYEKKHKKHLNTKKVTKQKTQIDYSNVLNLIMYAKDSYKNKNYFDAHYYATMVLNITPEEDGNRQLAKQIANESWNKISETNYDYSSLQTDVYELKRKGYFWLMRDEYVKAYYLFSDLLKKYPQDNDIIRYYEVAKQEVLNHYFYIEETTDLQPFEQYQNVYFTLQNQLKGKDVIFIKGVTIMEKSGKLYMYLRGFSVISYDALGNFTKSFRVPFAKVSAVNKSDFLSEYNWINDVKDEELLPYAMLESLSKDTEGEKILPTYSYASEEIKKATELEKTHYVFPMKYNDLLLLCSASLGAQNMDLSSLIGFSKNCSKYGFSYEVYTSTLIRRLYYPFFIMTLILFAAIFGWNYRMPSGTLFKLRWIFSFPIFTMIIYILMNTLDYFQTLLNYTLISYLGYITLPIVLVIYGVVLVMTSVYFVALRGE